MKNVIILTSIIILIMSLGLGLQYSNSQTIQDSKAAPNLKFGLGDQPTVKEEEEQTNQGELENETVTDEGELENKTVTQGENQTVRKVPKFGAGQIAPDVTGPTVATPTFYNMKIIFNYIDVCN